MPSECYLIARPYERPECVSVYLSASAIRFDFARAACVVLNELRPGTVLDASLLTGVTTSNAGQAAKRPLASGLKLDKTQASLLAAGVVWKPRTVQEALKDWVTNPRGKPLGE